MLAAMPADELAETLCVLAGPNAGNAARHFGKYSYDSGDVAGAIVWSQVAMSADLIAPPPSECASAPMPPIPLRLHCQLEGAAYEVISFAALAIEAPQIAAMPQSSPPALAKRGTARFSRNTMPVIIGAATEF